MVTEQIVCDVDKENFPAKKSIGSPWFFYFSAFTDLLMFNAGITFMWTSPAIPNFLSNNTEINPIGIPVTTSQISTMASLPTFFGAVGLLALAKLSNRIGRRKTMLFAASGIVVAFNVMAFAKHLYIYYVCLSLSGFCVGGFLVNVPVYVMEMSEDSTRGKFGCLTSFSIHCGVLYGYITGSFTSVKRFNILCSLPSLLHLILSIFIEESPVYLVATKKKTEALTTLEKLRGHTQFSKLEKEFKLIEECLKNNGIIQNRGMLDLFRDRATRKGVFLSVVVLVSQQSCGSGAVFAFVGPVIDKLNSNVSGNMVGIILGIINVFVYLSTIFYVDKFGRRRLMLISSLNCCFVMLLLGFYFYLEQIHNSYISSIPWVPVLLIMCFIVCFGIGLGSLPFLLVSELLPCDLRAIGTGTCGIIESLAAFLVMFSFPMVSEIYGTCYALWGYSILSFFSFNIFYFFLPETKCKNLLEIQELLSK